MNPVEKYYARHGQKIDSYWQDFTYLQFDWILKRLRQHYSPEAPFSVLDCGCGTGALLSKITDVFPNARAYGLDTSTTMIELAKNKLQHKADIHQADLNNHHFDRSYDVIISTTVLHHLDNPAQHCQNIAASLNDNGHAFISEFALKTVCLRMANLYWSFFDPAHQQAWSVKKLQMMLKQSGLGIKQTEILKPDWFWRLQIYDLQTVRNLSSERIR